MIVTTVPSNLLRPGVYSQYKFVPSGQQLVALPLRVVDVAVGTGTAAVEVPFQAFDEDDADTKAGRGSDLALMLRKSFEQSALDGLSPEIWGVRIAPPAGVATQNTITVTGPATASGTLTLTLAGRTLNVGVSAGDANTAIAAAIKAQIDLQAGTLPGTATVASNVVTLTHPHTGVSGNDVALAVASPVAGVGVAFATSVPGTGVPDVTAAVDALYDKDYDGIAIANHAAADVTDLSAHLAAAWGYSQQRPRFSFIGERGALGVAQTLATAANQKGILVVNAEGAPNTPGEMAAAACLAWFAREAPNVNMDGVKLALYAPLPSLAYSASEIESALAGGVTPLTPTPDGFLKIERLTTTATTLDGQPFAGLREPANSRTAAWMARQITARFVAEFKQETLTSDVLQRIRDMVISVQRSAEALGYIRDVDDLLDQIVVEESITAPGRVNVTNPFRVAGPLHQAAVVHTMFL